MMNIRLLLILLILGCLSNGAFASSDTQVPKAANDTSAFVPHRQMPQIEPPQFKIKIPFLVINENPISTDKNSIAIDKNPITDDVKALMLLMRVDSCGLYGKYFLKGFISDSDLAEIKKWRSENNDVVDKWLIEDAKTVEQMYHSLLYCAAEEFSDKLFERIRWRRGLVRDKVNNNGFYNQFLDICIKSLRWDFVKSGGIGSIYLSFDTFLIIEMINFLNGERFVDCDDRILTRGDLYKLTDWWWANKGNIPDEEYDRFYNKLYLECLLEDMLLDKQQDRSFINETLKKPEFQEYRRYNIIKME